jgi:hypothetical protein
VRQKSHKDIQGEIQAIIRQVTASVTFLPLLEEPCSFDLLVYADAAAAVPLAWEESDPRYIAKSAEVRLRSFTTTIHKVRRLRQRARTRLWPLACAPRVPVWRCHRVADSLRLSRVSLRCTPFSVLVSHLLRLAAPRRTTPAAPWPVMCRDLASRWHQRYPTAWQTTFNAGHGGVELQWMMIILTRRRGNDSDET